MFQAFFCSTQRQLQGLKDASRGKFLCIFKHFIDTAPKKVWRFGKSSLQPRCLNFLVVRWRLQELILLHCRGCSAKFNLLILFQLTTYLGKDCISLLFVISEFPWSSWSILTYLIGKNSYFLEHFQRYLWKASTSIWRCYYDILTPHEGSI